MKVCYWRAWQGNFISTFHALDWQWWYGELNRLAKVKMDRKVLRQVAPTLILAFLYATRCSQYANTLSLEKSGVISGSIPNCFLCFTHNLMWKKPHTIIDKKSSTKGSIIIASVLNILPTKCRCRGYNLHQMENKSCSANMYFFRFPPHFSCREQLYRWPCHWVRNFLKICLSNPGVPGHN